MKAKRMKTYRKLMLQYQRSFGLREPYQTLLDASIIQDAARFKMRLGSLLEANLSGQVKPMITQCCIRHLYNAPATTPAEKQQKDAWIEVAKQAERRRCGHHELEEPLSTLECLLSVVDPKGNGTNKHSYVIATQDQEVRRRMRQIAGVPLVYINRSVMILEPMADKSQRAQEADEKGKVRAGLAGRRPTSTSTKRKREDEDDDDEDIPDRAKAIKAAEASSGNVSEAKGEAASKKRKLKGPKGPNPLSVKKTKKEDKKPIARQIEDERSVIRKATKKDPQAAEKAVDAEVAVEEGAAGDATDGPRKRKRKRKAKEGLAVTGDDASAGVERPAEIVTE